MKTSADKQAWWDTNFAEQHAGQEWLHVLQKNALNTFVSLGLPSRKQERWKYTDVAFLQDKNYKKSTTIAVDPIKAIAEAKRLQKTKSIFIVLINGHFSTQLSETENLPENVVLCSMQNALVNHAALVKTHLVKNANSFASLNTALMTDGVFLHLPKNTTITAPIHFLYINSHQDNFVNCPRNMIIAEANSEATILEEHCAQRAENYFTNIVMDISAEENAKIYYHKIQNESLAATHISQIFVNQKKDSLVKMCTLAIGSRLNREDVYVNLSEQGAESSINGFYILSNDDQHIDNHVQIDHTAPQGASDMIYKGVLDKKSHAVFNGKVHVHLEAQKTFSKQANHNLLLSTESAVDTKPELEIYADDVKCSHADTVGQLDTESLFYLRSRGLDKQTAMQLLTYAFATDVMSRITHPAIKQRMIDLLNEKLANEN